LMRAWICASDKSTERFGLLNSEVIWEEEVANLFLLWCCWIMRALAR